MLALACVMWVSVAAGGNADLQRGVDLFAQYKYADAAKALTKARTQQGLSRTDLLLILELIGVSAAQQRQVDAAQAAFIELLTLDPEHKLGNDYAPRVMTPFFEAKRTVGERGALTLEPIEETSVGTVEFIGVQIVKDPMKQARAVRMHTSTDGTWNVSLLTPDTGRASLKVGAGHVQWWAELLGENDVQLALVGSEMSARVVDGLAPAPVAAVTPPPPLPEPEGVSARRGSGTGRTVSYVFFGIAAAAGIAGGIFAGVSHGEYGQVTTALGDGTMPVTTLTERSAYSLEASGKRDAILANSLFISAGAIAVVGLLLFILGGP